ncbi:MFS transporter [Rhodococcus sp. A14]|uniref:MFS transporter n=1 Tax=Rhodococcus sp. A14 TaxID=1194106 RepID=UPI001F10B8AB
MIKIETTKSDGMPSDLAETTMPSLLDDVPISLFHIRLAACASGGAFIDGYVLAIFGVAMVQIGPEFALSAAAKGAVAAMVLLGVFFGGFIGGYLTDRFGRQRIYKWDLAAISALSIASFFVEGAFSLIIMRLLVGLAVGIDYPIAPALLTEFSPKRLRGPLLGVLISLFFVGGAAAYVTGEIMLSTIGDGAWRWMLASTAVPAAIIAVMRIGTPESPLWLARNGRVEEANSVMAKVFGPGVRVDESPAEARAGGGLFAVVKAGYVGRLLFVTAIWICLIIPVYAIFAFGPQLVGAMHLEGRASTLGSAAIELFFAVGCVIALLLVNRVGRRTMTIQSFAWAAIPMLLLAIFSDAPAIWAAVLFAAYALFSGGMEVMSFVYPNELFPTELRGSAMGIVTALSRFGAAVGTFLVPISLENFGISTTMYGAFAITVVGLVISAMWAPETRNMSLAETSSLSH